MVSNPSYKPPEKDEIIRIGNHTYGNPKMVKDFPPMKNVEDVKKACVLWNKDPQFFKWGIRFSVGWFGDKYTLYSWERLG